MGVLTTPQDLCEKCIVYEGWLVILYMIGVYVDIWSKYRDVLDILFFPYPSPTFCLQPVSWVPSEVCFVLFFLKLSGVLYPIANQQKRELERGISACSLAQGLDNSWLICSFWKGRALKQRTPLPLSLPHHPSGLWQTKGKEKGINLALLCHVLFKPSGCSGPLNRVIWSIWNRIVQPPGTGVMKPEKSMPSSPSWALTNESEQ